MRIVFGWNHFNIKSFTPAQLGIGKEEDANQISIERRQKYFHLFWIPFFGIGKTWAVRKNGTLYELPDAYERHINSLNLPIKTPWYTFTGPLLIIIGFAIYWLADTASRHHSNVVYHKQFDEKVLEFTEHVKEPTIDDYFQFDEIKNYSENVYLKVAGYNDTSIKFQLPIKNIKGYSPSAGEVASCFSETPDSIDDYIFINKKQLNNYIQRLYEDYNFKGAPLPTFNNTNRYKLEEIKHFEGSDLKDYGVGYAYNNEINIELQNIGTTTTITEFKIVGGNVEWKNPLPFKVSANEKFKISGTYKENIPSYNVEIVCKEQNQKLLKYFLKGEGIERTFSKEGDKNDI